MFEKVIVIDGRGHLVGRLASVVAKELLNGQKIVVVRCEELIMSNSIFANKIKFKHFEMKRTATNPKRGPFHQTSPAQLFKRALRGMLPRKTARGHAALQRFRCYEGIPAPYDTMKRLVVPSALKVMCLRPGRKYTNIGELASQLGWGHAETLKTLEDKRKVKASAFYEKKKAKAAALREALKTVDVAKVKPVLDKYGM